MQAGFIPFCLQETITANTANAFTPSAAQLAVENIASFVYLLIIAVIRIRFQIVEHILTQKAWSTSSYSNIKIEP